MEAFDGKKGYFLGHSAFLGDPTSGRSHPSISVLHDKVTIGNELDIVVKGYVEKYKQDGKAEPRFRVYVVVHGEGVYCSVLKSIRHH